MSIERKQKLETLKRNNNIRIAKQQLIADLNKKYKIDISNEKFIEYQLSEDVHKEVYEIIRTDDVLLVKFPYEHNAMNQALEKLFNKFHHYKDNDMFYYPSVFGCYFSRCNQLYLKYPIAIKSTIRKCRNDICKIMHDIHDDIIVVERDLKYGFVLSEDEYEYTSIEYWGV